MTDDEPLDLSAVSADDDAVERLRAGGPVDDGVLALLRDLVADVEVDLPADAPVVLQPVGRGSTVLALAGDSGSDKRLARGGAVVVALTAGLVSLGGVAAASTLVPQGAPLHGLGEAVRTAVGSVVGAVTPPETARRVPVAAATPSSSPAAQQAAPKPAPTGAVVAAAVRSQAAARQVARLLDQAEELIASGRGKSAVAQLDLAERRLAEVLPAHRGGLPDRLVELRSRVPVASAPAKPLKPAKRVPQEQQPKEKQPKDKQPKDKQSRDKQSRDKQSKEEKQPSERKTQPKSKSSGKGGGDEDSAGKGGAPSPGQLSESDASANPRA